MNLIDRLVYEFRKGNSAIRQIIILCLGVFVFTWFLQMVTFFTGWETRSFLSYFYLPADLSKLMLRPWTILTYIFFHAGLRHIAANLIILYFIGRILQDFLRPGQVWTIFLGGGIVGGLFFLLASNLLPNFGGGELLGASGGVTAIIAATGLFLPRYNVYLFGMWRIEMRWLASILIGLDLIALPTSINAGGLIAHIGGAVFGLLYILELQGKLRIPKIVLGSGKGMKATYYDESKRDIKRERSKPDQQQIDAILDKISQSGYDSLSKEEKEILFKASK